MEEVSTPEPENSPSTEPLTKSLDNEAPPRKKEFNFRKLNHRLSTIISISLKLVGIIAVVLLLLAVVRELRYSGYQLQEVHVPKEFEDAGITGNAIAAQTIAHLQEIKYNVENNVINQWNYLDEKTVENHFLESASSEVKVELVGVGLSLSSVINLISNSLGISQAKKITTFIKVNNGKARLSIYVQNEMPMEFDMNVDSLGLFQAGDLIAQHTAESILKISNAEMLMYYLLYRTGRINGTPIPTSKERDRVIELVKFALQRDADSTRHKYYYSFWGWALLGRNNAEGEEKYKHTLLYDKKFVGAYLGIAWAMRNSGQYEKARRALTQAMRILEDKNTRIPGDRRTFMLQWCYNDMGRYFLQQFQEDTSSVYLKDSALYFITKSVYPSPKDNELSIYSSTASLYLSTGYYDSAMKYSHKANKIINLVEDKRRKAGYYNDWAFNYSEAGLYDTALVYINRAVEADSTHSIIYTTLAEIHGYQKDREKFYYYLEKAFTKGYDDYTLNDLINPPPPYSFYNKEERYKKLWKKYVTGN